jgi:3-deoxy-D-manno-octulosonic-acid transferase
MAGPRSSTLLSAYRALTGLAEPLATRLLRRRLANGKEDPDRMPERLGRPGRVRPRGALIWVHAASVGESLSVLPLIREIGRVRNDVNILVTTGTVTSGRVMGERLPSFAFHQFVPVDTPSAVKAFLDHWRPDLALWVESELWPNMLSATHTRRVPMILINARMSDRSFRGWRRASGAARELIGTFDLCLAQDEGVGQKLKRLGARRVLVPGNLKLVGDPLPHDAGVLGDLRLATMDRPIWLLASSHPGEEEIAGQVHLRVAKALKRLLTVIVPRHPQRGAEIAEKLASNFRVRRRSKGELPAEDTEIYIADTLGELGVFFRLAPVAVMGGSFVPHGGQNPLEPARLGVPVLSGPHVGNFKDIYRMLSDAGGAEVLPSPNELAGRLVALLDNPEAMAARGAAAMRAAGRREPLICTMDALEPYLVSLRADARS